MGIGAHIKDQWLGLLIGAVGIVLSVYFYIESRETRDPVFIVDPSRAEIISHARVETAPIRVLRNDGKPITADLYAVRFYFWNRGKRSIRSSEILDSLRIKVDSGGEILDSKILSRSRPITGIVLQPHRTGDRLRELAINFAILEHNDGFTGQVIYEGKPNAQFRIVGTIEGDADGIRDGSSLSWTDVLRYSEVKGMLAIIASAVIAFFLGRWRMTRRIRALEASGTAPTERREPLSRTSHLLLRGFMIVLAALLVSFVGALATKEGREQARSRIVNAVPRNILP